MSELSEVINNVDFDDAASVQEFFIMFNVSRFDHYLNSDECDNEVVICYSDVKSDPLKMVYFNEINDKFIEVYNGLYDLSDGNVSILIDGVMQGNVSSEAYSSAFSAAIKENPLCGFLFSNLGLYVMVGYDLTHTFYILKYRIHLLDDINILIKKSGLFILDF